MSTILFVTGHSMVPYKPKNDALTYHPGLNTLMLTKGGTEIGFNLLQNQTERLVSLFFLTIQHLVLAAAAGRHGGLPSHINVKELLEWLDNPPPADDIKAKAIEQLKAAAPALDWKVKDTGAHGRPPKGIYYPEGRKSGGQAMLFEAVATIPDAPKLFAAPGFLSVTIQCKTDAQDVLSFGGRIDFFDVTTHDSEPVTYLTKEKSVREMIAHEIREVEQDQDDEEETIKHAELADVLRHYFKGKKHT